MAVSNEGERDGSTKPKVQPEFLGGGFSELVIKISKTRGRFLFGWEKKGSFANMLGFLHCIEEPDLERYIWKSWARLWLR